MSINISRFSKNCVHLFLISLFLWISTPVHATEAMPLSSQNIIQIEKDPWLASSLNLLPFGVGSFYQGDTVSGAVITTIDGAALGALLAALWHYSLQSPGDLWIYELMLAGAAFITARVLGVSLPWVYEYSLHNTSPVSSSPLRPESELRHFSVINVQLEF